MPVVGVIYLVSNVVMGLSGLCLNLEGMNYSENAYGYVAHKFRKIIPACDRVTIREEIIA